ncbi:MAG: InlB B-repeat-containing protein [Pseudomonadota bacterium]
MNKNSEEFYSKLFIGLLLVLIPMVVMCGCTSGQLLSSHNSEGGGITAYTVTYDGNYNSGGTAPTDTITYMPGEVVTTLGNTGGLVKDYYVFSGWNTRDDQGGTTYTQAQTFIMGEDNVTLYARWTNNPTYTVTYDGNANAGGAVPTDTTNYEQGMAATVFANTGALVKTGFAFSGWNTQADGGGTTYTQAQILAMGAVNVTLYAKWTANPTYSVGGTVAGLTGTLVLQDNGGDDLSLTSSGAYSFSTALANGAAYSVTVKTQPAGQTCTVANPSGTISAANITNANVTCSTDTYSVGGTVAGLTGTVVLQDNATDDESINANGAFTFDTQLADHAGYAVTVSTQPAGQTCVVTGGDDGNGGGAINGANVSSIILTCAAAASMWARTDTGGVKDSVFDGVSVDTSGNSYAVGAIYGTGTFTFGAGVTAAADYAGGNNVVIVKYNTSGTAQWAKTVTGGGNASEFFGVSADTSGNAYAAGYITGAGTFTFGAGVTAAADYAGGQNVVIVKYNTNGTAQWAKTVTGGGSISVFNGVSVDTDGNAYAVGTIKGAGTFTFAAGVTAAADYAANDNVVIVKYNTGGTAQWAKTVTGGNAISRFKGVSVDASGNAYAAGHIRGTGTFTFGAGVTATGDVAGAFSVVIVKYNTSGTAQWAKTVSGGGSISSFAGVSADTDGNSYAVGYISGAGTYTFAAGVTAAGDTGGTNVVIAKYNTGGTAQWAKTVSGGVNNSFFDAVSVNASGNIYASGEIDNTGTYTFGAGVTATANYSGPNVVIVKYNTSGTAQSANTVSVVDGGYDYDDSEFKGVSQDPDGNAYAVGYLAGYPDGGNIYTFGPGVSVAPDTDAYFNVVIVKYTN